MSRALSPRDFQFNPAQILKSAEHNKGTAFSNAERWSLKIAGLLPPRVETLDEQHSRALAQFRSFSTPLERYIYLSSLQERNTTLFYKTLIENLEEMMPIVYTPTVGLACQSFSNIFRSTSGLYISMEDKDKIRSILDNWRETPDIIVVTDGSRILGLGDLGVNGMGIPIGKLSLYVAGAGFHPSRTLPVCIDVGTNNESLRNNQLYLGLDRPRDHGKVFEDLMEEFLVAVQEKWPSCLVQFEDFSNDVCFDLLERYRNRIFCFNDDIQGTGAVIMAGFINACKMSGIAAKDQRLVFLGAGSAGIGVADQIVSVIMEQGLTAEEARERFWFVDSNGLVTLHRGDKLQQHKVPYARKDCTEKIKSLVDVIRYVKPTGIIGLSGMGGSFSEEVIRELCKHTERPIIFPLSNPTSNSECNAEQAFAWSDGKCIFASGSPFPAVDVNGRTVSPSQGNNMYIFPGLGLGAVIARAKHVTDNMILAAAKALAASATQEDLAAGRLYPALSQIREISVTIASAVAKTAVSEGMSTLTEFPESWEDYVRDFMYQPEYST